MSTTRALESGEIHRLFQCISGRYALRDRTMLLCGIAMALQATELCRLNVGDLIDDNGDVKLYVKIRGRRQSLGRNEPYDLGRRSAGR